MIDIKKTDKTPEVLFNTENGELNIDGRSFPEDPKNFYRPILEELDNYKSDDLNINLNFEYLNTSSTKIILEMIKSVGSLKNLSITWVSEEDDAEMTEMGEYFSELSNIPFNYETYL